MIFFNKIAALILTEIIGTYRPISYLISYWRRETAMLLTSNNKQVLIWIYNWFPISVLSKVSLLRILLLIVYLWNIVLIIDFSLISFSLKKFFFFLLLLYLLLIQNVFVIYRLFKNWLRFIESRSLELYFSRFSHLLKMLINFVFISITERYWNILLVESVNTITLRSISIIISFILHYCHLLVQLLHFIYL